MREGEGTSQHTPKKEGNALNMMCCFNKTKEGKDSMPAPEYERYYKLGSLVPQVILVCIIFYIYYSTMAYYVMPLALGSYDLESFDASSFNKLLLEISNKEAPKSSFFLSMVTMQERFFSLCAMLGKFDLDKTKGWVIFSILHVLMVLLIWSIIKTSKTPPGRIVDSKRWKEEIDGFEQQLEDQEMGFLQAFEQKYSLIYLRNQRQSKNIPVDERAIERLSGGENPIQSQNVFSEKNDSEDENHSAFNLPETARDMPLHPIKEIPRESLEESVKGVEDKQPAIDLSFHHGEEQSFRSESEVVFEDRQESKPGETAMTAQVAQFFSEKNSRENLDKNPAVYDQEEYDRLLQQLYRMHVDQEIEKRNYRPCKKCDNLIKPPRTHHCSQCKDCVLKMDHHCQWVDNCIGFRNYKYFLNMLFYSSLALSFCSVTYAKCYLDACVSNKLSEGRMFRIALSFFFIITMNFFVLCFTIFHFWLVMLNKTTIEFCEKKTDSQKYDLGCWYNLKSVFGSNIFTWFFPTEPDIEGEGTLFLLSIVKE